jgi:crotonobetainyl-CoA:carnitine CoA-transferase CaiB-like acyl-CoA transferase
MGTAFPSVVPYQVFPTADSAVAIAVGSEKLWSTFCGVIGRPDLETHPDYATNGARIRNRVALEPLLAGEFRKRSTAGWIESLHGAGIPASPVRNFKDVVEHAQSAVREMFPTVDHPKAGTHRVTGTPVKLSETPGGPGAPAPLLGQHTYSVLRDVLGLDETTIEALAARGAIYARPAGS